MVRPRGPCGGGLRSKSKVPSSCPGGCACPHISCVKASSWPRPWSPVLGRARGCEPLPAPGPRLLARLFLFTACVGVFRAAAGAVTILAFGLASGCLHQPPASSRAGAQHCAPTHEPLGPHRGCSLRYSLLFFHHQLSHEHRLIDHLLTFLWFSRLKRIVIDEQAGILLHVFGGGGGIGSRPNAEWYSP